MKSLFKLIVKATLLYEQIMTVMYKFNEDHFIEALGLDPKDYEIKLQTGEVAYDYEVIDLLNKIVPEVWADYVDA